MKLSILLLLILNISFSPAPVIHNATLEPLSVELRAMNSQLELGNSTVVFDEDIISKIVLALCGPDAKPKEQQYHDVGALPIEVMLHCSEALRTYYVYPNDYAIEYDVENDQALLWCTVSKGTFEYIASLIDA